MTALGSLRVLAAGALLSLPLSVAAFGLWALPPVVASPDHETFGALLAAPLCALVATTVAASRRLAGAAADGVVDADVAAATAAACRAAGLPAPVCIATRPGAEPGLVRGFRRTYLLAPPGDWGERTDALVAVAARDLRSGDAAVLPVLAAVPAVYEAWRAAWRLVTVAVRPGAMKFWDRVVPFGPLLLLAPIVGVGAAAAWVAVQLARVLVPPRLVRRLLGWFGTSEVVRARPREVVVAADDLMLEPVAFAQTAVVERAGAPVRRRWWSTPGALAAGFSSGALGGPAAVVALAFVVAGAAFSGFGQYPAQRIVWPGEGTAPATAVAVTRSGEPDSLLGRLGVPVGVDYEVVARAVDGRSATLPRGTNPVEVGDRLVIVGDPTDLDPGTDGPLGSVRSRGQDSVASIAVVGVMLLGLGAGALKVIWDLGSPRTAAVTWQEYVQARAAGRAVRRPRSPLVRAFEG